MPKAQIPIGYSKAEALGNYGPTQFANVYYFDTSVGNEAYTPPEVAQAVAAVVIDLYNKINSVALSNNFQVTRVRVTYRADESSIYTINVADAMAGSHSGDAQDAQVAFLINWTTGDPRKGGKPRQYICGVPNSVLADSAAISTGSLNSYNVQILDWLAAFPVTGVSGAKVTDLVEMSFVSGKVDIDPPFPRPVELGAMSPYVATQRRRIDRLRS